MQFLHMPIVVCCLLFFTLNRTSWYFLVLSVLLSFAVLLDFAASVFLSYSPNRRKCMTVWGTKRTVLSQQRQILCATLHMCIYKGDSARRVCADTNMMDSKQTHIRRTDLSWLCVWVCEHVGKPAKTSRNVQEECRDREDRKRDRGRAHRDPVRGKR